MPNRRIRREKRKIGAPMTGKFPLRLVSPKLFWLFATRNHRVACRNENQAKIVESVVERIAKEGKNDLPND